MKALLLSRLYMICQFFWSTFGHPARIDPQRRGAEGFVANIGSKPRCFSFSRVRHSDPGGELGGEPDQALVGLDAAKL